MLFEMREILESGNRMRMPEASGKRASTWLAR